MATEPQLRFIRSLIVGREIPARETNWLDTVVRSLGSEEKPYARTLSKGEASEAIEKLKQFPMRIRFSPDNPRNIAAVPGTALVSPGMYRNPTTGKIWKVQYNKANGSGRYLYAKSLDVETEAVKDTSGAIVKPAVAKFNYAPGAMRHIRPEWRMSLDQAKAFGAMYGVCCRCGTPLTDEESIAAGIGPICAGKI